MLVPLFRKLFGSHNERFLRRQTSLMTQIDALEKDLTGLSDEALRGRTGAFRQSLENGNSLDNLLPEAFAVVREAARRNIGQRHFGVQLLGGICLHLGKIAEMRTGEGKTLAATLPAYLNALSGKGVHVVTVNDYLARRDAEWMGRIYQALGLETGVIVPQLSESERTRAYAADVVYGTNSELGFDYLRNNMVPTREGRVQRELNYAIVDEVDSILIDEARTPLIISGHQKEDNSLYPRIDRLITTLGEEDYSVDEKLRLVHLSEEGHARVEQGLVRAAILGPGASLYDPAHVRLMYYIHAALRARLLFKRDIHYIVQGGKVVIVDEFTGRTLVGRRWSDGLHQAIEAKEKVPVQQENLTLASITYQNFFRLYGKLSGMTGTADTEAHEFRQIYGLDVLVIPTHKQMIREDFDDLVFLKAEDKFHAIIEDIQECCERHRPVLVGTTSIEVSEHLSELLRRKKIGHAVLNAKQHEREAEIIAQAGRPGNVTIATNMAGRGTDIVLGGNQDAEIRQRSIEDPDEQQRIREEWRKRYTQVVRNGGLHIIGTERHESRRIDNQLRGRSGRQGDPGSSRFYLSLEDNLLRIFASERISGIMQRVGMSEGEAIEHPWLSRVLENAQRKVETQNFDARKHLLEYDDVANEQRKVVYTLRNRLLDSEDISSDLADILEDTVETRVGTHISKDSHPENWDLEGLQRTLRQDLNLELEVAAWLRENEDVSFEALCGRVLRGVREQLDAKRDQLPPGLFLDIARQVTMGVFDRHWRAHLSEVEQLRLGIGLRGYAQRNPMQEFKREAFEMFLSMQDNVRRDVTGFLCHLVLEPGEGAARSQLPGKALSPEVAAVERVTPLAAAPDPITDSARPASMVRRGGQPGSKKPFRRAERKRGRNEACPCGSGRKYKHCHGRADVPIP